MDFRLMTVQCLKNSGPADDALEFMQSSPSAIWARNFQCCSRQAAFVAGER